MISLLAGFLLLGLLACTVTTRVTNPLPTPSPTPVSTPAPKLSPEDRYMQLRREKCIPLGVKMTAHHGYQAHHREDEYYPALVEAAVYLYDLKGLDAVSSYCAKRGGGENFIVVDKYDRILLHPDESAIGKDARCCLIQQPDSLPIVKKMLWTTEERSKRLGVKTLKYERAVKMSPEPTLMSPEPTLLGTGTGSATLPESNLGPFNIKYWVMRHDGFLFIAKGRDTQWIVQ